ncbi:MAG: hypothetical protein ACOVNO_09825 [Sediminibacterium sp.]
MNKNILIKNRLIKSSLLNENQFSFSEEKLNKEQDGLFSFYYSLKFYNSGSELYFYISFTELYDKKAINSIHFWLEKVNYNGKGYRILSIDDFCTINNLENEWNRVNNFQGITFEEKLNNLITDFEQFVRSTDLIKVFRGEVWYDQYWINPRD